MTRKNPPYVIIYLTSAGIEILINYLLLSRFNLNSTINVTVNLVLFMFVLGFVSMSYEKISNKFL